MTILYIIILKKTWKTYWGTHWDILELQCYKEKRNAPEVRYLHTLKICINYGFNSVSGIGDTAPVVYDMSGPR